MGRRRGGDAGKLARNFPFSQRWKVDQDYVRSLPPEALRWLAEFNDRYYGGDFREIAPEEWPPEVRSVVNADKNASRQDIMSMALGAPLLSLERDLTLNEPVYGQPYQSGLGEAIPAYLDSDVYKTAREDFRSHLRHGRMFRNPVPSPALDKARKCLERVTPDAREEE